VGDFVSFEDVDVTLFVTGKALLLSDEGMNHDLSTEEMSLLSGDGRSKGSTPLATPPDWI
jgi:hypothetical protein